LARGIGSLLLAPLLYSAVRFLTLPLPFLHVAIGASPLLALKIAVALAFHLLTLRVLIELLAGTMLAFLSHDPLRQYCKSRAKYSNKTKISYFHGLPFFPIFITGIEPMSWSGCMFS
jgi:hypothetical protein